MSGISKLACFALALGMVTGCARLRPAATPQRAVVSAASCDTARAVALVRANLVGALRAVVAGKSGAETNAYDAATRTPAVATAPSAGVPRPGGTAAASATSAAIRETQTTVALWSAEAGHTDAQASVLRDQIVQLDRRSRGLPTAAACRAAGFDGAATPGA